VDVGAPGALDERLDDVRRGPELGVPAPQVDERRAVLGRGGGDASEKRDEVLLGKPLEAGRLASHGRDRIRAARRQAPPFTGALPPPAENCIDRRPWRV